MMRFGAWAAAVLLASFLLQGRPALAFDLRSIDLGSNVEVWFSEDHTVPIVAFAISLPAGSAYDPPKKAGLASLAASLMDEGAGNMASRAFQNALADHAIRFRANAERDDLVISIVTLSENAPLAMHLLQMALTHPRFDPDAVARMRTQMIQAVEQGNTMPPTVARRAFAKAFFDSHPYGHPTDGDVAGLSAITTLD
ncbi:MAG: M16 family metallopeptidase, partial [Rhizomicrobium sp.]